MATSDTPLGPRLAVITVSYGSDDVLPAFLTSVAEAASRKSLVLVADNLPSKGDSAGVSRSFGATYRALPSNLGYGGAINSVAAELPSSIEWLLISNPDVVLGEGTADLLIEAGEKDPSIGSVGPAIWSTDGQLYPSARSIPSLRTGIGHALFANLWINNPWTKAYRNETTDLATRREAGWLSGACLLVRRSAFESIGGFDSSYFMYFEDVDLGYRFGKAGFRNVYEPSALVTHVGAHSTQGESKAMIAAHHTSARQFLSRKYPGWYLWPLRAVLTIALNIRSRVEQVRSGA